MRDRFADLGAMTEVVPAPIEDDDENYEPEPDAGQVFMEKFFADVKSIRDNIADVEEKIAVVEHKHEDLLVAYSQEQTAKANSQLEKIMSEISALGNKVRQQLKVMDKQNKQAEAEAKSSSGSADLRIRKSQHSTLSRKFVAVMTTYNDIQADNKNKYREAIKRQCKIVDPNISDDKVDHLITTGTTADIFKGKRLDEAEQALSDIKDRHEDILRLERSLMELHEMFLDMALLVEEQGDMVDRIERSVDKAENYVGQARKKIDQAQRYQADARQKRLCCYIILFLGCGVIVGSILGAINP